MDIIYTLLSGIHILAAIIGLGPAFAMNSILRLSNNLNELKHAYKIVHKLEIFAGIGMITLLVTGLLMGLINPALFQTIWYDLSLLLLIITIYNRFILDPKMKPMLEIVQKQQGSDIPAEYHQLAKKTAPYDRVAIMLPIFIILLMIFKPM